LLADDLVESSKACCATAGYSPRCGTVIDRGLNAAITVPGWEFPGPSGVERSGRPCTFRWPRRLAVKCCL